MKSIRQGAILEIISSKDIETQEQLILALEEKGIKSTQATVSRDIRELNLVKELTERGTYRYAATPYQGMRNHSAKLKTIFKECVTSFVCAQNIVILKTLPGLASAACSAIDGMEIGDMAGTIAGDDTAFLAMFDNESAVQFCKEIEKLLK